jgi:hypothetical protein
MYGCSIIAGALCAILPDVPTQLPLQSAPVDVELVLAADTSVSMDEEERLIQVRSYAQAFRDANVHAAIQAGPRSRIAVTYVEWSGETIQRVIVPWMLIDSSLSATQFADRIAASPIAPDYNATALGNAIQFATGLFERNIYEGERKVIDVSGDGRSNAGLPVAVARDAAIEAGATINGLPLLVHVEPDGIDRKGDTLADYYWHDVIGGPGAFQIVVRDIADLEQSLRRKLIREIAGNGP